ncbi:hypothetical protein [uncultured Tateyamaria sp.]|nr:hypothetical protein [uncultured Tateyamaria sp.]
MGKIANWQGVAEPVRHLGGALLSHRTVNRYDWKWRLGLPTFLQTAGA